METKTYNHAVIENGVFYPAFTPVPVVNASPVEDGKKKAGEKTNDNKRTSTTAKSSK